MIDVALGEFLAEKKRLVGLLPDQVALKEVVALETYLPSAGTDECCQVKFKMSEN